MQVVNNLIDLRTALRDIRALGKTIAFVPTMGNLHEGHLTLIQTARQQADFVVASIFINPTQFGENEDLSGYPRTLEADQKHLPGRFPTFFIDFTYVFNNCCTEAG